MLIELARRWICMHRRSRVSSTSRLTSEQLVPTNEMLTHTLPVYVTELFCFTSVFCQPVVL